jgi:predicted N-acetyltransferase YhbS
VSAQVEGLELVERVEPDDRVRLSLVDASGAVAVDACTLTIDHLRLHDGRGGLVRVDGIGNVATLESHRRRGLATQLLDAAVERMRTGGASASLLYGIDGFYGPLGWHTCGDERWVRIELDSWREPADAGLVARPMQAGDLEPMRGAYERCVAGIPGAASRSSGRAWTLLDPADVVVVERDGLLAGWAWLGQGVPERDAVQARMPGRRVVAELQAVDDAAMLAVVDAAVAHARAASAGAGAIVTGACEAHPLRRVARAGLVECALVDEVRPRGGAMLRAFDDVGEALLASGELYQFLPDRF